MGGREGERETERKTKKNREQHVIRGYIIVADIQTKSSNPHPRPNPNPHTQASRPLVFPLFYLYRQTDQQTDGWTDGQSLQSSNERENVLPGCPIITLNISKFK